MVIGHMLNRTADVLREVRVPDGAGGWTAEEQPVLSGARCRIPQPTDTERVLAQQAGAEWDTRVYFPARTDVRRGDTLRAYGPDERFRVVAVVSGSSPGVYVRADVKRVQHAGVGAP